jgi:hypothetical protein
VRVSKYQKFHFDYCLGPGRTDLDAAWTGLSSLQTLAPGTLLIGLPLNLQPDAAFLLTGLAVRVKMPVPVGGGNCQQAQDLRGLRFRFTGPDGNYLMDQRVPLNCFMANYGQLGNPKSVYPNLLYAPQSTILVDVENASPTLTFTNLEFYFRGVKLFPWGLKTYYPYPEKMATIPFNYNLTVTQLAITDRRLKQIFTAVQDGDFVWRATQAGVSSAATFWDVYVKFYNEQYYPHSNIPVHTDVVFGRRQPSGSYAGILYDNAGICVEAGPANPGLWYPEIYIPNQHQQFFDIFRDDSSYNAQGCPSVADFPMVMIGAKVYPQ